MTPRPGTHIPSTTTSTTPCTRPGKDKYPGYENLVPLVPVTLTHGVTTTTVLLKMSVGSLRKPRSRTGVPETVDRGPWYRGLR